MSAMKGAVVSTMVTTWVAVELLPEASVAVQVTVVVPSGNRAGASLVTAGLASHRSATCGVPRFTGVPASVVCSVVMPGGAVMLGGVVSTTVMTSVAMPTLPDASVAFHVTV